MNPAIIKNNFSRYARCYDRYARVQDRCAGRLITLLQQGLFEAIMDVGCGTGGYTARLRCMFPNAAITAVDVSPEMIAMAQARLPTAGVEFIVADAQTLLQKRTFDLITSNASFQWLENMETALLRYHAMLAENGSIVFSMFGPETFQELSAALSLVYGRDIPLTAAGFLCGKEVRHLMSRIFRDPEVSEETVQEEYPGVRDLLNTIKYSGTRGEGLLKKGLLTPRLIDRLETVYHKEFGGVVVTYQTLVCRGRRMLR